MIKRENKDWEKREEHLTHLRENDDYSRPSMFDFKYMEIIFKIRGAKKLTSANLTDPKISIETVEVKYNDKREIISLFFIAYKLKSRIKESIRRFEKNFKDENDLWFNFLKKNYNNIMGHAVLKDEHNLEYSFKIWENAFEGLDSDEKLDYLDWQFNSAFYYFHNKAKELTI
jgi:hypothetical protein